MEIKLNKMVKVVRSDLFGEYNEKFDEDGQNLSPFVKLLYN